MAKSIKEVFQKELEVCRPVRGIATEWQVPPGYLGSLLVAQPPQQQQQPLNSIAVVNVNVTYSQVTENVSGGSSGGRKEEAGS